MTDKVSARGFFSESLKWLMDISGALAALVLFSPVFLYLIYKVRQDGGPAFYGQKRVGKNGRPFYCLKFRSMVPNAAEHLKGILEKDPALKKEWEENFKLKNDPRITKIGHFLRKTSLDELPQIFNVLKGEMSLVGPRPIVEEEIKFYKESINDYYAVKPGITGLWQVSGRSDVTYDQRVALDSEYVINRSIWKDLVIILKTVGVIFRREGAY